MFKNAKHFVNSVMPLLHLSQQDSKIKGIPKLSEGIIGESVDDQALGEYDNDMIFGKE